MFVVSHCSQAAELKGLLLEMAKLKDRVDMLDEFIKFGQGEI